MIRFYPFRVEAFSTFLKVSVLGIALAAGLAQAQSANYYRENITLPFVGGTGGSFFSPHTGTITRTFTQGGTGTSGISSQEITFDSYPAPYVAAAAMASMGMNGIVTHSAVLADLQYGFSVTGVPNAYVAIGMRGRYEVDNANYLTQTSASMNSTVYGWDYSRADQLGFEVSCRGTPTSGNCAATTAGWPTTTGKLIFLGTEGTSFNLNGGIGMRGEFLGNILVPTDSSGRGRGTIMLQVNVNASDGFSPLWIERSFAFIDPALFIDPDFLVSNPTAQLLLTPGVGNQMVPVPEPSTVALIFSGIFGLLFKFKKKVALRAI